MNFIAGIFLILIGAWMIAKTESVLRGFGRVAFFEKYLGVEGGSRLGYKLVGFLFAFFGILALTGLLGGFMSWLFAPLIKTMRLGQ